MKRFECNEHIGSINRDLCSITMNGKAFYTMAFRVQGDKLCIWLNNTIPSTINTVDNLIDWFSNNRTERIIFNSYR